MSAAEQLYDPIDEQEQAVKAGKRPKFTVQQVFLRFSEEYLRHHSRNPDFDLNVLADLTACRTALLGGHLLKCPGCAHEVPVYNQCQNRCCPTCQAMEREVWIEKRMSRMLPIGHFQVVFTLPAELREVCFRNQERVTYRLLHESAWETIKSLADEHLDGAKLGASIILHTWSRAMVYHPHAHCVISSGGLSRDRTSWVPTKPDFLFSIEQMRDRFRDIFLAKLERRHMLYPLKLAGCPGWDQPGDFERRLAELADKQWIAYVERPFTDAGALTRYLGQYTHRIAISDWRILDISEKTVEIATRDGESVVLTGTEFIRRFLLHVPPKGKSRIRHYGLYSPAGVHHLLDTAWSLVAPNAKRPTHDPDETWEERLERIRGVHPRLCPKCRKARMVEVDVLKPAPMFADQFHWRERRQC